MQVIADNSAHGAGLYPFGHPDEGAPARLGGPCVRKGRLC